MLRRRAVNLFPLSIIGVSQAILKPAGRKKLNQRRIIIGWEEERERGGGRGMLGGGCGVSEGGGREKEIIKCEPLTQAHYSSFHPLHFFFFCLSPFGLNETKREQYPIKGASASFSFGLPLKCQCFSCGLRSDSTRRKNDSQLPRHCRCHPHCLKTDGQADRQTDRMSVEA